jgi:hypothetical protein
MFIQLRSNYMIYKNRSNIWIKVSKNPSNI